MTIPECKYRIETQEQITCSSPCIVTQARDLMLLNLCKRCVLYDIDDCYRDIRVKQRRGIEPANPHGGSPRGSRNRSRQHSTKPNEPLLGDLVENALTKIGITKERVSKWIGQPCGCDERKEKLNRLHSWSKRILSGKTENAEEEFDKIVDKEDPQ